MQQNKQFHRRFSNEKETFYCVIFAVSFFISSLWGQLTIDSGGRVGIGADPMTTVKLRVFNNMGQYGNYAIYAYTSGVGAYNFGLWAYATSNNSTNYSIYGQQGAGGNYRYAGYFSGNVTVTGTFYVPSDIKLKENIKSITPVLANLMKLKAKSYTFKKDDPEYKSMNLASGKRYGFTAQELEEVFPDLVSTEAHPPEDEKGEPLIYKSINYIEMIPILVQAIQEQQEEIEELKKILGK